MQNLLATVPNKLTAARFVLLPVMWVLAIMKLPFYVGVGIFICLITDVLDGYVARRLNQVSQFGGKFDSLADNLLIPSALVWLWLFRPEIFQDNAVVCGIAGAAYGSSLLLGAIKFRRFANLHLYSSKAAGVAMYLVMSLSLIADHYSPLLFIVAGVMFIVSSTETLLLQAVCPEVDEHMGSLLLVLRRRNPG